MSDSWLRRMAQILTVFAVGMLLVSAVMLYLAPDHSRLNWLESQVKSIATLGAPLIGLVIVTRQPRQRIGWLWIFYGVFKVFRVLGHGIYYYGGSQPGGYSSLEYFLLWSTEPAFVVDRICLVLLMLWFPTGKLLSARWKFLYYWLVLMVLTIFAGFFTTGSGWNGGATADGIVINNPYGWLPISWAYLGFFGFISLVLIQILAAVSMVARYRSAGILVRLQLRWFVLGGLLFTVLDFLPIFISQTKLQTGWVLLVGILSFSAILPLYLAVGIAILRYRLFDIDIIIRRTLQYTLLTGLLALVYFSSVLLLQSIVEELSGQQSPIVIVISTLTIAALFNPLRLRVQVFIDRRFFRKKYDAEQTLARFAVVARDEVDMDKLTAALLGVVDEAMQSERVSLWLGASTGKHDNPPPPGNER